MNLGDLLLSVFLIAMAIAVGSLGWKAVVGGSVPLSRVRCIDGMGARVIGGICLLMAIALMLIFVWFMFIAKHHHR